MEEQEGSQKGSAEEMKSVSQQSATCRRSSLSSSIFSRAMLSQRIVNIEYYMAAPVKEFDNMYSDFRNSSVKRVPVIRIFGATPAGQKICANIHGVYPYISVLDDESVDGFEYRIASALDSAINESVNTNKFGNASANFIPTQHVFKVIRVVGRSFYGYRSNNEVFLRIFFYNPLILKKAVDLLQSGNILGRRFQPYEAHIPYSLQFMIDYCLYGMNFIHYSDLKFRRNIKNALSNKFDLPLSQRSNNSLADYFDPHNIEESLLGPRTLTKMTLCELEVDVIASDIIIDNNISGKGVSVNPGIDSIWKDEIERRRQQGVDSASQITIPDSQDRSQVILWHSAEEKYQDILWNKVDSNNSHDSVLEKSFSQSLLEEEIVPSSQILDHLSAETCERETSEINNELTQEEDEFMKLLEEMAAEVEAGDVEVTNEDQMQQLAEEDLLEEDAFESDIWDDSFSASILEAVADTAATSEESPVILQCDGQTNDSDSSSDSGGLPKDGKVTRLSKRTNSRLPAHSPCDEPSSILTAKGKSVKFVDVGISPGSRLSLAVRRQSRSQELKSQGEPAPSTSKSVRNQQIKTLETKVPGIEINQRHSRKSLSSNPLLHSDSPSLQSVSTRSARRRSELQSDTLSGRSTSSTTSSSHNESVVSPSFQVNSNKSKNNHELAVSFERITGIKPKYGQKMVPCVSLKKIDPSIYRNSSSSSMPGTNDAEASQSQSPLQLPVVRSKRIAARKLRLAEKSSKVKNTDESTKEVGDRIQVKLEEIRLHRKSLGISKKKKVRPLDGTHVSQILGSKEAESNLGGIEGERETEPSTEMKVIECDEDKTHENIFERYEKVEDESCEVKPRSEGIERKQTNELVQVVNIKMRGRPKKKRKKKPLLQTDQHVSQCETVDLNGSKKQSESAGYISSPISLETGQESESREIVECSQDQEIRPEDVVINVNEKHTRKNEDEKQNEFVDEETQKQSKEKQFSKVVGRKKQSKIVGKTDQSEVIETLEQNKDVEATMYQEKNGTGNTEQHNIVVSETKEQATSKVVRRRKRFKVGIAQKRNSKDVNTKNEFKDVMEKIQTKDVEGTTNSDSEDFETSKQSKDIKSKEKIETQSEDIQNKPDETETKECLSKTTDESPESNLISDATCPLEINSQQAVENQVLKADAGVLCKPIMVSKELQTEKSSVDISVQASAETADKSSQTVQNTTNTTTQTLTKMISVEIQTDAVPSLCLCQCSCVYKEKADKNLDVQEDLKPVLESKRIQVDNVDIITKARSVWYTTPQNKTKNTTPLRSPDKRRSVTESPRRRHVTTPTSSRYLSALLLKTPTSHHKSARSYRENSSTPTECNGDHPNSTPPSRESKEGYLIHSIRSSSSSPRKRILPVRPKSLHVESHRERVDKSPMENWFSGTEIPCQISTPAVDSPQTESSDCDLSVNSIYEYEDAPSPSVETDSPACDTESSQTSSLPPSASLTWFQRKRILSKHRSKIRLEKRKAANLEANRGIPDIFDVEFEPLKLPASYKSTGKWLEAEKHRVSGTKLLKSEIPVAPQVAVDDSSDEEAPPAVKLFGGGNLSDDDEDDSRVPSSSVFVENDKNEVHPFTPEFKVSSYPELFSQNSSINAGETPRSILRQRGSSRRQSTAVMKRKIRWEDEEPSKRIKMEIEDDCDMPILSNETLNKTADTSELDGPTFKNALGLENSMSNLQDAKALHQSQFLTSMCIEVHCSSRNGLTPDPAIDPILAVFILISSDYPENFNKPREFMTVLIVEDSIDSGLDVEESQSVKTYANEIAMFEDFINLVRFWDPDILVGFEVEKTSFGYLIQRGTQLGKDMAQELSRLVPLDKKGKEKQYFRAKEEWNGTINGRIVLNLWRLLRHEITVQSYTFENAAYHILRRRVYKFSYETLNTFWFQKINRFKVIQYYSIRIRGAIQIMEKLDLVNRTSELARLFGIQFYEVLSRGSQFRVESMMLRATKPLDYIAPSPTVMQRAKMRAPEYLPLILEPRSNYYTDPVAVLDFQSLYPSMMIAYNYDYASVLGRVEHLGSLERFPLGCLDHQISPSELLTLKDSIHISPAGVAFLKKSVCTGVVPEMLKQILDTRQMVKRAMKRWKGESASLQKVLDSRQLGLKLIANVTYGYTSANFSGRMPCVEIADSIVSKGRETLQRAIDHVKSNYSRWGGDVIYGDTDSLFVLFRGRSREDAFKLAYEMADEVTQSNPKPVKLKFEKIYQPCILQSKKRYVGFAYETPDQKKPVYDAKGIETVRRDGCPAVKKILEKTLHVLFTSNNKTKVEEYIKLQFEKLFKGRVSMQDYIFAREFRGRAGYKPAACVPSLEIAKRLAQLDPRAEPLVSERVPYVVIYGNPTLPLIKLVRTPEEFLRNPEMRLNAHYYIEKAIIPAVNRCLKLAGMDAFKWYAHLPRKFLRNIIDSKPKGQGTLDAYVLHQNCFKCGGRAERGLCSVCLADQPSTVIHLQEIVRNSKSKLSGCLEICTNCSGETRRCISIDCPVLHKLTRYQRDQVYTKNVERELLNLEW
ncbi:unnamed protein product [Orchesella dallaii]|uniref:DNA polymerase zeta catalytic subunit n=1 Tax=Orchesella dallaii TaxID=48710 RepID=A0ABP1Q230_9HEXA